MGVLLHAFLANPTDLYTVSPYLKTGFVGCLLLNIGKGRIMEVHNHSALLALSMIVVGHIRIEPAGIIAEGQFPDKSGFDEYLEVVINRRHTHTRKTVL